MTIQEIKNRKNQRRSVRKADPDQDPKNEEKRKKNRKDKISVMTEPFSVFKNFKQKDPEINFSVDEYFRK